MACFAPNQLISWSFQLLGKEENYHTALKNLPDKTELLLQVPEFSFMFFTEISFFN